MSGGFRSASSRLSFCSLLVIATLAVTLPVFGQSAGRRGCPETSVGGTIESPKELRSHHGRLQVTLSLRNSLDSTGQMQYCYVDDHGDRSPTLRLQPGDLLLLTLRNELLLPSVAQHSPAGTRGLQVSRSDCASSMSMMARDSTNLHFHGLSIPPGCHADDSLRTSVTPSSNGFLYRFRIPRNQPAGLYWYHPHPHGYSEEQVLGGASGALIVEGIARANPQVEGLPERVLVIRDRNLDSAVASKQNASHDPGLPAKDLSLNFVRVPYPQYPVGIIHTVPAQRELWRVLNASADTYVDLAVLFNGEWQGNGLVAVHGKWQSLGLVAVDGVPITEANSWSGKILWKSDIAIPPGGRAEFIVQSPPEGVKALFFTAGAETTLPQDEDNPTPAATGANALNDNDDFTPPRPLARIVASNSAVEPKVLNEGPLSNLPAAAALPLSGVAPVRQRKLYFSEKVMDAKNPQTSTVFYLTEEGHVPKAFDPHRPVPDIVVRQGDVEDWTIENRSPESHAFHIHQIHFLVLERNGAAAGDSYLADTVDVPYWDGTSTEFPSVKLRMDFRNPDVVGTFPYHCHILQHSDGGMMGLIQVQSPERPQVHTARPSMEKPKAATRQMGFQ